MSTPGIVTALPRALLRLEALCIFVCSIWAYKIYGLSWWTFAAGLFLPDLGMTGYVLNTTVGAAVYNACHTEAPPVLLLMAGYAQANSAYVAVALIWLAHISMDRMMGFGLKYSKGFGCTHLGDASVGVKKH